MSAFSSRLPLAPGASADVIAAGEGTVITNFYLASRNAGNVGHLIDCTNLAHTVTKGSRPDVDTEAYRLETAILDLVLLQKACNSNDAVILAIVGAQRAMELQDRVDIEDRPLCDAIAVALMNLAGWILQGLGRDAVNRLPEELRTSALDYIDNYAFGHSADPQEG